MALRAVSDNPFEERARLRKADRLCAVLAEHLTSQLRQAPEIRRLLEQTAGVHEASDATWALVFDMIAVRLGTRLQQAMNEHPAGAGLTDTPDTPSEECWSCARVLPVAVMRDGACTACLDVLSDDPDSEPDF